MSILGGGNRLRVAALAAAAMTLAAITMARALARTRTRSEDHRSATRRARRRARGFRQLTLGPGEGLHRATGARHGTGEPRVPRTSLAYFGQLSDFQLADEESPARVELVDPAGPPVDAAWRPWEALEPQIDDAMVRQLNAFSAASPLANGNGTPQPHGLHARHRRLGRQPAAQRDALGADDPRRGHPQPGSGVDPATSSDPACAAPLPATLDA